MYVQMIVCIVYERHKKVGLAIRKGIIYDKRILKYHEASLLCTKIVLFYICIYSISNIKFGNGLKTVLEP